ncbi:THAP domain-containing protein 5-like [Pseudophryne corroboree]|uniref:THAP domain-containing protein 5-like n=1 Tax=Pseudophryne corroboree TaxID=495146 RepID=UPI003081E520
MPMTCVAYGCNNHFVKGTGKQFFRFPMKDPERLSKWVVAIRRKNWKPSASSRICSDHFTDNDYMLRPGAMVPRLRLDAVPSIFDGFPKHLKERLEEKRKVKEKQSVVTAEESEPCSSYQNSLSITSTPVQVSSQPKAPGAEVHRSPGEERATDHKVMHSEAKKSKIKTCVVYGCNNTSSKGCKQQFFRLPVEDPDRLSKWVEAIQHQNWEPSASSRICSDHFIDQDYVLHPDSLRRLLRADAVPSAFSGISKRIQVMSIELQSVNQIEHSEKSSTDQQSVNPVVAQPLVETTGAKLHGIHKNNSSTEIKQQVKHGPVEKSHVMTCVVYGCNSIFTKESGKRFYRFPMKNPERLSKWVQAVQRTEWQPSSASRVCSDHFKDKDYILRPGSPRLRPNAVPSVIIARKRIRRKNISLKDTDRALEHYNSMEVLGGDQGTDITVDHTYSTVHNAVDSHHFNPDALTLKKKVRTLQRQIQRQRHTIKKLSEKIVHLKNITDLDSVSSTAAP